MYKQLIKKLNLQVHNIACHAGPEMGQRHISTLSFTSALDGECSTPHTDIFTSGSTQHEAGWSPRPFWTDAENLASQPGRDPQTIQPVASRYTDYSFQTHKEKYPSHNTLNKQSVKP